MADLLGCTYAARAVKNRQSFVYLESPCYAICTCLEKQAAHGETFVVGDGDEVSTPQLMRMLSMSLGDELDCFPSTPSLLKCAATVLGFRDEAERLLESLVVDIGKIQQVLLWKPPYSMVEALRLTA